jgi:hypothetical protein
MQTSIQEQIANLHQMTVRELCQRYAEVYGEPTRAHRKPHMIREIAWRILTGMSTEAAAPLPDAPRHSRLAAEQHPQSRT